MKYFYRCCYLLIVIHGLIHIYEKAVGHKIREKITNASNNTNVTSYLLSKSDTYGLIFRYRGDTVCFTYGRSREKMLDVGHRLVEDYGYIAILCDGLNVEPVKSSIPLTPCRYYLKKNFGLKPNKH